jgi:hypothetical protein
MKGSPGDHRKRGSYDAFDEARIRHLELIQDVISRLGNDGFLVKGWCLTFAGALFGFAFESRNAWLAVVAFIATLAFWWLDAYFLRCERLFRLLYARVSDQDPSVPPFFMAATLPSFVQQAEKDVKTWRIVARPALWRFYAAIATAAFAITLIVGFGSQQALNPTPVSSGSSTTSPTPATIVSAAPTGPGASTRP